MGGWPAPPNHDEDREVIVKTAKTRPVKLGRPFTHWSIRKLVDYLATKKGRRVRIGRERLRQILAAEGITFQRTRTWKESPDPLKEEKLARIEWCLETPGPGPSPSTSSGPSRSDRWLGWAGPRRANPSGCGRTTTNRTGPGSSSPATPLAMTASGVGSTGQGLETDPAGPAIDPGLPRRQPTDLRDPRQLEPPPGPSHPGLVCGQRRRVGFHPTYASWANPIEAHFGPLRQFVLANSDHADHPALGRALRAYLRWRNTHTRDPQLLEHQRRHRARIRSEQQRRWGHPKPQAA